MRATVLAMAAAVVLAAAAPALAQDASTRADLLRRAREEKAQRLQPPEPSRMERVLVDLENGRFMERLLNRPEGLYPRLGNITAGSGLSLGPGYRQPGLFGGHADLQAFGAASFSKYWIFDAQLALPRLADERLSIDLRAQRYSFPAQEFFGLGSTSRREDLVTYGIANGVLGAALVYRPTPWLAVSGGTARLSPDIDADVEPGAILSRFTDAEAPGVLRQPAFLQYDASLAVDVREPRGNPRRGGLYRLGVQRFADLDDGRYSFDRLEADLRQYIPFLHGRRVLAIRALASTSEPDTGSEVPFYLQSTLGGPDDLRGFRRFRFRGDHVVLFTAEYRWEIFTAVDGALFYDTGKVASRAEGFSWRDVESDFGIGFRFGTVNGVFLRVEGAFGSRGGKHFILRFGDVF